LLCSKYPVRVHSVPSRSVGQPSVLPEAAVKVINLCRPGGDAPTPMLAVAGGAPGAAQAIDRGEEIRRALAAEALALAARHTVIVHARSSARAVADLLAETADADGNGLNVLARDSHSFAKELLVTIEKLVGGEIFGLEKYLCWGANVIQLELRHTDEKYVAIDLLQNYATSLGLGTRAQALATAADELIMNAFFHAPRNAAGERPNAHLPRTTPLATSEERAVVIRYGSDGVNFGLLVADAHGSLDSRRIAQLLTGQLRERRRSLDLTRASSELGLTTIAESVSHLVFNIEAGKRTEIIALVEVEGPPRMGRGTGSINVFSRSVLPTAGE
jgi:hypothetical protein